MEKQYENMGGEQGIKGQKILVLKLEISSTADRPDF